MNMGGCGCVKLCWRGRNSSCSITPPLGKALTWLVFHKAAEKDENVHRHFCYFKNRDSVLLSHEGDDFLPYLLITETLHKY